MTRFTAVSNLLDDLAPTAASDEPAWDDVLARAELLASASATNGRVPYAATARPLRVRRRRPRRRAILIAAAVALLIVLFATPAFGLQQLVLDLIGRKTVSFSKAAPAPNEIKKQFADLGVGAPPRYALHVLAGQARNAGTLSINGKRATLWVAPAKAGGYCYDLAGFGGCVQNRPEPSARQRIGVSWAMMQKRGQRPLFTGGMGQVYSDAIVRLELVYSDGTRVSIPFIWVSKPIGAGFFGFHIPAGARPAAVLGYSKSGHIAARAAAPALRPMIPLHIPPASARRTPRTLPTAPTVHPTAPLQQTTASGVSVVAGANGAVQITADNVPAAVRRLLQNSVSFSCFRLTREFGIFTVRGFGTEGAFTPSIGFQLGNLGRPLDGCEITSERGHRWPDAFGSHGPVELSFTAKGRAYFADRAAARDLALFVRSRRMQQIRKEHGHQLLSDIHTNYGHALAHSRIHYTLTANGITFTETSTSGKQFKVMISHGRIVRQNLKPYTLVF